MLSVLGHSSARIFLRFYQFCTPSMPQAPFLHADIYENAHVVLEGYSFRLPTRWGMLGV